jgi:1-acyl-sn-glycerol-3-phosphate acyltransferase
MNKQASERGLLADHGILINVITLLRAAIGSLVMIPFTGLCSILSVIIGLFGCVPCGTRLQYIWARVILWAFGIDVEVKGEQYLPEKGGGIVVFNHQSLFDIPILLVSTNKHFRFGAKIELFRIPIFGAAMRAVGTLPIARENRAEVLRVYEEAKARFANDILFVLAPEGTRQKEPVIGRFKKGPFLFAINAGVPLMPVVMRGAHKVLPKKNVGINVGRWRGLIEVEYLPPVSTAGLTPEQIDPLMNGVREDMVRVYSGR